MRLSALLTIFLLWASFSFAQTGSREQDSLALVALYNATDGANWTYNTNWLQTGQPINTWWGVTVENNRVTQLRIQNNNLNGSLPTELSNLTALTILYMGYNSNLTGSFPDISNMKNLEILSLNSTGLTGAIPDYLSDMTSLEILYLEDTHFSGQVPDLSNLTNLTELTLSYVTFPDNKIPDYFQNFSGLTKLILTYCSLEGAVPDYLANLGLTTLNVYYNHLNYLPEFPSSSLGYFKIAYNEFDFGDIEYNMDATSDATQFFYNPQFEYGRAIYVYLKDGDSYTMSQPAGGTQTSYQWYKGTSIIAGATSESYTILNFTASDEGTYQCQATNSAVSGLTLKSKYVTISSTGQTLQLTVKNAITHEPISGATIVAAGQEKLSDIDGKANFGIPGGTYTLEVSANNYKTFVTSLTFGTDGSTVNFEVNMEPETLTAIENSNNLTIYPNPSDGNITIPQASKGSVLEVYNLSGQKLATKQLNGQNVSLNLKQGLYILKLHNGDKIYTSKLVIN